MLNVSPPQWDAFSFPELCNFLRILKREEEAHVRQIVKRYTLARDMMKQAIARVSTPGWIQLILMFNHEEEHSATLNSTIDQQCKREGNSSDDEMLFLKQEYWCYI